MMISVQIENSATDCREATLQLLPVIMDELRQSFTGNSFSKNF